MADSPPSGREDVPAFPDVTAASGRGASGSYGRPRSHRGGLLLALGIVALLINVCTCFALGGFVWWAAHDDLQSMQVGRMDARGYGLTQTAMILGIVATAMHFCLVVFRVFYL